MRSLARSGLRGLKEDAVLVPAAWRHDRKPQCGVGEPIGSWVPVDLKTHGTREYD